MAISLAASLPPDSGTSATLLWPWPLLLRRFHLLTTRARAEWFEARRYLQASHLDLGVRQVACHVVLGYLIHHNLIGLHVAAHIELHWLIDRLVFLFYVSVVGLVVCFLRSRHSPPEDILRLSQCPGSAVPLAAFQVSTDGRFFVSPEARSALFRRGWKSHVSRLNLCSVRSVDTDKWARAGCPVSTWRESSRN